MLKLEQDLIEWLAHGMNENGQAHSDRYFELRRSKGMKPRRR